MNVTGISADEKLDTLDQLLASVTFRRAEQLRQFLKFIVEEEVAGRGPQIREVDIAVRALNRPASWTPETDSTVRTRAHALRQRLAEYYRIEAPEAEIRVELPKGGYTPVFVRVHDTPPASDPPAPVEPLPQLPTPPQPAQPRPVWQWVAGGALAGALLAVLVTVAFLRRETPTLPSELAEAWGPIFDARSTVRVILSSPYQIWVRDYRSNPPPVVDPVESPPLPNIPEILRSYASYTPLYADSRLYMHSNNAGALWGDAAGVQVATRFLAHNGASPELTPEKSLKSGYVLRNDSYLVFGRSEYSPLIAGKLPDNAFDVMYVPSIRRHGIAVRKDPDKGPKFLPTPGPQGTSYGLVTIIRDTADDGHPCQAMYFSGVISNGSQAGIEYMTTPRHVKDLVARLRAEGIDKWPKALQVVVRTDTSEFYPIRTEYQTHRILER